VIELLCKVEAQFAAQANKQLKLIDTADRISWEIGTAEVKDEGTIGRVSGHFRTSHVWALQNQPLQWHAK